MNILLIGSGGREHALAWKLTRSPHCTRLYVAPGNGGTAALPHTENLAIRADQIEALLAAATQHRIELVVVGPEAPLGAGIVDRFTAAGIPIFGPTRAAAQLECSKAHAKAFMQAHAIPTARAKSFSDHRSALLHVMSLQALPVIKVSGLAAGKGVYVPTCFADAESALHAIFVEGKFGAVDQVIIEEMLHGPELSLLAFCDGTDYALMPSAQDHKRLLEGDQGPNTGGMGAVAPSPLAPPELLETVERQIIRPTLEGMAKQGTPFVGVLFLGLMLTGDGPRVLEYNARFGDPEAQVLLPLLESDLVELILACVEGRLAEQPLHWRAGAAATVVLAAGGYPDSYETGTPIHGLDAAAALPGVIPFHAGTVREGDLVRTAGGRVLSITGLGQTLPAAVARAYDGVAQIAFQGAIHRRDIGRGV